MCSRADVNPNAGGMIGAGDQQGRATAAACRPNMSWSRAAPSPRGRPGQISTKIGATDLSEVPCAVRPQEAGTPVRLV
jgi:hypothetical protein